MATYVMDKFDLRLINSDMIDAHMEYVGAATAREALKYSGNIGVISTDIAIQYMMVTSLQLEGRYYVEQSRRPLLEPDDVVYIAVIEPGSSLVNRNDSELAVGMRLAFWRVNLQLRPKY